MVIGIENWVAELQRSANQKGQILGEVIARLKISEDVSNAELARAAEISESTVRQITGGSIMCPPIGRLEGMARALGVSTSTLTRAANRDGCEYETD